MHPGSRRKDATRPLLIEILTKKHAMTNDRHSGRLERVLRSPKSSAALTLGAMLLAFVWVNSPYASAYESVHHAPASVTIGGFVLAKPMILWINEGLMVFFFFLIGLEIKREVLEGQLSSPSQIALPAFAAVGGMAVPAAIYLAFNHGDPAAARGWAVPVATDIVLALACLAVLGRRVPLSLKVFLTALAIFDDFGTLIVIATFYSEGLSVAALLAAVAALLVLVGFNRFRVGSVTAYGIVTVFLWAAVLESGVHATLAGVLAAWTLPMRVGGREFLHQVEHDLTPWVALLIVPLFAFFNAGIALEGMTIETLLSPVSLGVVLGLFLGKPLGVTAGAGLAVATGLGRLPPDVGWPQICGVALLAGVGFTMSLFVAALAFEGPGAALSVNLSVVIGSALSATAGLAVLARATRSGSNTEREEATV